MAGRHGPALHIVDAGQQVADAGHGLAHGGGGAAALLDRQRVQGVADGQPLDLDQRVDLVHLAAEAEHDHGGEVRVAGVAGDGPAQRVDGVTLGAHAAAVGVGQRDHPVDVGVGGQRVAAELVGDHPRGGGRAVHRGQHADVVAGRHAPVRVDDALEGGALRLRHEIRGVGIGAEGVVALEAVAHAEVVDVDMVARLDRLGGESDDLVVLAHRIADRDGLHRDLMAGGNRGPDDDVRVGQGGALRQIGAGNDHIVRGMQANGQRCHGGPL